MNITAEQRAILASRIIEIDDWLSRASDAEILAAVEKYRPVWAANKDAPGYKTAMERASEAAQKLPSPKLSARDAAINELIKDAAQSPNAPQSVKDYAASIR